jgi:hypothetical protein
MDKDIIIEATYLDEPWRHRLARDKARAILRGATRPDISRTTSCLIVSGWFGQELHTAAYWPAIADRKGG